MGRGSMKQRRQVPGWARSRTVWRNVALTVTVVLVNVVAFSGQVQWAVRYLDAGPVMPWLFAAALESVGIYLAWEAHAALMAGDAALRLRVAAYSVAGLVGWLNYTVHADGLAPTPAAVAFGVMSASSPWLWAIRSRSLHRAELRTAGLIDARVARFAVVRWVLYPRLTWRVWRHAVWVGVVDPAAAIAAYQAPVSGTSADDPAPSVPAPGRATGPVQGTVAEARPAEWSARVAEVARDIRRGQDFSIRAVRSRYGMNHARAKDLLEEATTEAARLQAVAQ